MPSFNGSGPGGKGPMTGVGRGNCIVSIETPEQELGFLRNRALALEAELRLVRARMKAVRQAKEAKYAGI